MPTVEKKQLARQDRPCHSLAIAVRLAARLRSVALDEDTLVATLGWPWLLCAAPSEPNPTHWPLYARDAFLAETCKLLGLTLRAVHPPEAARGLWAVAEFRQHFDLSYRPIIEHALKNNQPVLAWRGWSGETAPTWGVINGTCESGVRLRGIPCDSDDVDTKASPTLLDKPPVQVYVVESAENATPSPARIIRHLESTARRALSGELDEKFAVVTGSAAIDLWIEGLASKRIDSTACECLLHSVQRSQESLRRVLAGDGLSSPLIESSKQIADILSELDATDPLPTLRLLREHLIDLHKSLTS